MRVTLAFIAGFAAAAIVVGALGSVLAAGARADCAQAQRDFSAWRAENPDVPVDASIVPSCRGEDAAAQLAMGAAYVGVLMAAGAIATFAWSKRARATP